MVSSAEHERKELRRWLHAVYGWVIALYRDLYPGAVAQLKAAQERLCKDWAHMLPLERAEATDIALEKFCKLVSRPENELPESKLQLSYHNIAREIGFSNTAHELTARLPARTDEAQIPWQRIHRQVQAIQALYLDRHPQRAAVKPEVQAWVIGLISDAGVTPQKIQRLGPEAVNAMEHLLRRLAERVEELGSALPAVEGFLPTADELISAAEAAIQSPADRLEIFGLAIDSFRRLYSVRNRLNLTLYKTRETDAAHVERMFERLGTDRAREDFERLAFRRQYHAIGEVRSALFAACEMLVQSHTLPQAEPLMDSLLSLFGPSPAPPPAAARSPPREPPRPPLLPAAAPQPRTAPPPPVFTLPPFSSLTAPPAGAGASSPAPRALIAAVNTLAAFYPARSADAWARAFLADAAAELPRPTGVPRRAKGDAQVVEEFVRGLVLAAERGGRRPVGELPSFAHALEAAQSHPSRRAGAFAVRRVVLSFPSLSPSRFR
ncbi:hypothetical protein JCM10449v2_006420 [Rhodotorula kratochvilovae]